MLFCDLLEMNDFLETHKMSSHMSKPYCENMELSHHILDVKKIWQVLCRGLHLNSPHVYGLCLRQDLLKNDFVFILASQNWGWGFETRVQFLVTLSSSNMLCFQFLQ